MGEGVMHVAVDIGCIECGAPSSIIGVGDSFGEALEIAEAKVAELKRDSVHVMADRQTEVPRWTFEVHHRQHAIEILPVR